MAKVGTKDIEAQIAKTLAQTMGGTRGEWRELVGPVCKVGVEEHTNWCIHPVASFGVDYDAVMAATALVRARYPYVDE